MPSCRWGQVVGGMGPGGGWSDACRTCASLRLASSRWVNYRCPMTTYRTNQEEQAARKLLTHLRYQAEALALAQKRLDDAVAVCRTADIEDNCLVGWAAIGQVLGITKQAAQQRYRRRGIT